MKFGKFVLVTGPDQDVVVTGSFSSPMNPSPEIISWGTRSFHKISFSKELLEKVPDSIRESLKEGDEKIGIISFYSEGDLYVLSEGITCHLDIYSEAFTHEIDDGYQCYSEGDSDGGSSYDPER
tara:strand:- start:7490 stop:7861 length:372 start_codon:yes stop_codon:yes gene_type:complete